MSAIRIVRITKFPYEPSRRIDKRLLSFIYFHVLHRVELSGRWGRFIPLRQDDRGDWFVGIGTEFLDVRWWAGPFIKLVEWTTYTL